MVAMATRPSGRRSRGASQTQITTVVLVANGRDGMSEKIYMWAAHGAFKTPMSAAFAIGQDWDAAVLLDNDPGWPPT